MSDEAWPTPQHPAREPLPRVEDLPIAEQGYEPDSVRAAFDSFYRHAAQLDASLRTLEAVDSFHRQAAALRADLRVLRTGGWTQQSWPTTPAYGYGVRSPREGVSPAVWRIAGEVAFLIVVSVVLGVAKVPWWVIVLVMAVSFVLVALIEWAASRDFEFVRSEPLSVHPVVEAEASAERADAGESLGWTAFEEAQEPSDAMTMIGVTPGVDDEEAVAESPADEPASAEEEPAAEPVADASPRRSPTRRPSPPETAAGDGGGGASGTRPTRAAPRRSMARATCASSGTRTPTVPPSSTLGNKVSTTRRSTPRPRSIRARRPGKGSPRSPPTSKTPSIAAAESVPERRVGRPATLSPPKE
ncbi:MAG: SdpI family protein [Actinobacteria bacterium]|nr:MAG: SdpI family protein [Actinomycetota bacterium]